MKACGGRKEFPQAIYAPLVRNSVETREISTFVENKKFTNGGDTDSFTFFKIANVLATLGGCAPTLSKSLNLIAFAYPYILIPTRHT